MLRLLRSITRFNRALSVRFDNIILKSKPRLLQDGMSSVKILLMPYLDNGLRVADLGSGSRPQINAELKQRYNLQITGIDISLAELEKADESLYDYTHVADIQSLNGHDYSDFDLAICVAVLEHVPNTSEAISSISTILRQGGTAVIFVPNRKALFARLNLILPERIKRALLFGIMPENIGTGGFKSYYNACTPRELSALASAHGLRVEKIVTYFMSSYFANFLPVHIVWRLWSLFSLWLWRDEACETFTIVLSKPKITNTE